MTSPLLENTLVELYVVDLLGSIEAVAERRAILDFLGLKEISENRVGKTSNPTLLQVVGYKRPEMTESIMDCRSFTVIAGEVPQAQTDIMCNGKQVLRLKVPPELLVNFSSIGYGNSLLAEIEEGIDFEEDLIIQGVSANASASARYISPDVIINASFTIKVKVAGREKKFTESFQARYNINEFSDCVRVSRKLGPIDIEGWYCIEGIKLCLRGFSISVKVFNKRFKTGVPEFCISILDLPRFSLIESPDSTDLLQDNSESS